MSADPDIWNSLEIVNIVVGILTPITVVSIGFLISRRFKKVDYALWINQKLVERRLKAFDEMSHDLNDLYCYFTYVGSWKERSPSEIIEIKRRLDQVAHVNYPLFSNDFMNVYQLFIDVCFETYTGWGNDAKIRTKYNRRKEAFREDWDDSWKNYYSVKSIPGEHEIKFEYAKFMRFFSTELGIMIPDK